MLYAAIVHTLPERYDAGAKLEVDEDEVPVVIDPATAAHLRALADVLLRNGESGAFKAYVEVDPLLCVPGVAGLFLFSILQSIALKEGHGCPPPLLYEDLETNTA